MAVKGMFDALNSQVQKLEGVSAEVSVAASMTDIRREMADMRRAERIGPDLARFETTRAKWEDKASDLYTEILKVLLKIFEVVEPGVQLAADGIAVVAAGLEKINANIDAFQARFTATNEDNKRAAEAQAKASKNLERAIRDFGKDKEEEEIEDPFLKQFIANFAGGGQL